MITASGQPIVLFAPPCSLPDHACAAVVRAAQISERLR